MKLKKLFSLKKGRSRKPRANAFVLESLEPRLLLSATPMTAAVVTTDHLDYAPGETAVITTSNTKGDGLQFEAGELVRFQVSRTDGMADNVGSTADVGPMGNEAWYVTDGVGGFTSHLGSDVSGDGVADWIAPDNDLTVNSSISTTWFVEEQYRNSSLLVTAAGQESGTVATQAFTDANINTTTVVTADSATSIYGSQVKFTATVTAAAGTVDPTGSVEFFDGTTSLGVINTASGGGNDGIASYSLNSLNLSASTTPHLVRAVFTGGTVGADTFQISEGSIEHVVTQKSLRGDFAVANKVYDGTTVATVTTTTLNGVELIDLGNVALDGTANFVNGNVGVNQTVTFTITPGTTGLTGSAASNYTLELVRDAQADITPATVVVSDYTGAYDGLAHGPVALDPFGNPLGGLSTVTHTDVGIYTESWTFANANYVAASGTNNITITRANVTVTGGYSGVYDGAAHTATITATGVLGESLSGLVLNVTPHSNAGTYSDSWTFTDSTGNYNSTSGSVISSITALGITGNFTAANKVYDGSTAATVQTRTLTGVIGSDAVSLTGGAAIFDTANAGIGKIVTLTGATLTGAATGNYSLASSSITTTANIAQATVTITGDGLNGSGYYGIYDGQAHAASATVTGVGGAILGTVESSTTATNVGVVSHTVTYTDVTGNYNNASKALKTFILQATVTLTGAGQNGSGYYGIYDGQAHAASATVTGVGGAILGTVESSTTATNVGVVSHTVTFAGDTNYKAASKVVKSYILKASVTLTGNGLNGSGYYGTYDGVAHAATATVIGAGGAVVGQLVSNSTHTNAGTYSDTVTFLGDTNYKAASKTLTSYILKASVTITGDGQNGSGYFGTYDGQAHAATATVTGVGGAVLGQVVSSTPHTNAGTYSDTVTFLGDANYKVASKVVKSYILKASVTLTGDGQNGSGYFGTYDGQAHAATATVTGVGGAVLGQVVSSTPHTNVGIYSDTVTFLGDANYKAASKVLKSYII